MYTGQIRIGTRKKRGGLTENIQRWVSENTLHDHGRSSSTEVIFQILRNYLIKSERKL